MLNNFDFLFQGGRSVGNLPKLSLPVNRIALNATTMEHKLALKDYKSIIENAEFFKIAFCKVYPIDKNNCYFKISRIEDVIYVEGDGSVPEFLNSIETLRKVLWEKLQHREKVKLYFSGTEIFHHICTDKSQLSKMYKYNRFESSQKILPHLSQLFALIGAQCSYKQKEMKVNTVNSNTDCNIKKVNIYKIEWKTFHTYQIQPLVLASTCDMRSTFYDAYQKNMGCDFTLIAQDGNLKAHAIILTLFAGKFFQKALNSEMKESNANTLNLSCYRLNTIKAFLDFLYLGGEAFISQMIESDSYEIDVLELLNFAHVYDLMDLQFCCVNLLNLTATAEDYETIFQASIYYKNDGDENLNKVSEQLAKLANCLNTNKSIH